MSLQPLVSVCIPSYNSEEFIVRTIRSVLNQSLTEFEVVIVDDKSTDDTVGRIQSFSDARIRLIQNEANLGLGGNWNKTLSCASGKYIKLLCGDDILYSECLAQQVSTLENPRNQSVVLAICNRDVIDANDQRILRRKSAFKPGLMQGTEVIRKCLRWGANLLGEPAVGLFRADFLNRTEMCDASNPYYIDLALWASLLKRGEAFIDPACLAAFRVSGRAATAKIGLRQAGYFRQFIRSIRNDPAFRSSGTEVVLGYSLSLYWCLLRNLFIKFHSWKMRSRWSSHRNHFQSLSPVRNQH